MPLTPFQAGIFKVISANRNPDSFIAGGIVINRDVRSARFSDDIDIFHDSAQAVAASTDADAEALGRAGYKVTFVRREATFHQADISLADESIRLDWAADSAFRYFPVVPDEVLGFRLHDADAATNKVLAAVSRQKVRDFIDLMQLDRDYSISMARANPLVVKSTILLRRRITEPSKARGRRWWLNSLPITRMVYPKPSFLNVASTCVKWRSGEQSASISLSLSTERISFDFLR